MTEDLMTSSNETYVEKLQHIGCAEIPSIANTFTSNGSVINLSFSTGKGINVEYSKRPGALATLFNSTKTTEFIPIQNVISVRSKDCSNSSQLSKRRNLGGSFSSWRKLNQILSMTSSPIKKNPLEKYPLVDTILACPMEQRCGNVMVIHYVKKPDDGSNKWWKNSICLYQTDTTIITTWKKDLEQAIAEVSIDRPQKLLIFINPYGGKQEGKNIFYKKVAPLLHLSGVKYELIVTEGANHAKELLQICSLDGIDGVISVGGDGMFSEIFSGLLLRAVHQNNWDFSRLSQAMLRVGVIPAGKH